MRVTNNMMVNQLMYNVSNNLDRMRVQQDQMATGKKIRRPSDDPLGASKILKYRSDIAALDQYDRNTSDAVSWLEVTESSVSNMNQIIQRARELGVQAANGTNSADDRLKIKAEFEQLKNDMVANGNASFAGRYVFSSYHTDQKFLKEDGTFNIDITDYETTARPSTKYQIGVGEEMAIGTNGLDIFGAVKVEDPLMRSLPGSVIQGAPGVRETGVFGVDAGFSTTNFSGVVISVNGTDYTMSGPDGSGGTPITQEQLIDGIRSAQDGSLPPKLLGSFSNVSFDSNGQLVIQSKTAGDIEDIVMDKGNILPGVFTPARDSIYASGSAATRASIEYKPPVGFSIGNFDGNINLTGGVVNVDGVDYTIGTLDGTGATALTLDQMISGISMAEDGGTPAKRLDSVADIYMSASGSLVIKAKSYGSASNVDTTSIDTQLKTAFGGSAVSVPGSASSSGADSGEVSIPGQIAVADFSSFSGKSYVVTLNGNTQKITLGLGIADADSLRSAFQTALNAKFTSVNKVNVTQTGGVFSFATTGTPDGVQPKLEIRAVTSTKPKLIQDFDDMIEGLSTNDQTKISAFIGKCDENMENLMTTLSDIGARNNRLELVANRISENDLTFQNLLSGVEDADIAEVVMNLKNSENVYNASLSAGAKIIQPTLVDFLR